jgi:A/G-specific adenine glycosylase
MTRVTGAEFNRVLFAWHKKNYRAMAWRDTHDPYRILVSELMLQQTQVARVKEKYASFIKKYPKVKDLAAAPLGDVLRAWSGLGYNRRAKFLRECAKTVMEERGGKFPNDYDGLVQLPGIGRSTAGALLAFAFGHDTPMIDTNIRRILVRVFYRNKTIPSDKELYEFARALIPKGEGRMWNYAMLDLGATKCTARNHSDSCPMRSLHGKVGDFTYKKPQKKFAGSARYYRGKLMKLLSRKEAVRITEIKKELSEYEGDIALLVSTLVKEGMITKKKALFSLPK